MIYNIKKKHQTKMLIVILFHWLIYFGGFFFYILTGKFSDVISPTFKTASHQFSSSEILEWSS